MQALSRAYTAVWQYIWHITLATFSWKFVMSTANWLIWTPFYAFMASLHTRNIMRTDFMNYGYSKDCPLTDRCSERIVQVSAKSEDRITDHVKSDEQNNVRLYEISLASCPLYPHKLNAKHLLEIACGHGGGLRWMQDAHPFASVTGVDRQLAGDEQAHIIQVSCNCNHMSGDACAIPLQSNSAHILLCVEASHTFSDFGLFVGESHRLLRQDGYLVVADCRPISDVQSVIDQVNAAGFELCTHIDITDGVLKSRDQQASSVRELYASNWWTRYSATAFWHIMWGMPGTALYNCMVEKKWEYFVMCWKKKE